MAICPVGINQKMLSMTEKVILSCMSLPVKHQGTLGTSTNPEGESLYSQFTLNFDFIIL